MTDALRKIPQVDKLLREIPALARLEPVVARWLVRREVEAARARALADADPGDVGRNVERAAQMLERRRLRRVLNATGVVLHTNLGRAPLSDAAVAAVAEAAGATALEIDLDDGRRGARAPVAATLAAALCDAEDALIVNNNAAALVLALTALARGREVLVSRGELIEIGGGFRLPEVMEASGARLREVGTTNRTRAQDYRAAVSERTALLLKVHPSNYAVVGFTATPSVPELAEVAHEAGVPLLFDIGSGLLRPEDGPLTEEPDATTALAAGADLVCFSGDKLLGGPQAGILAGGASLVETCRTNPLARALRADKLTLAALEATLTANATGARATVPAVAMLDAERESLLARAALLARALGLPPQATVETDGVAGGGSMPEATLPSAAVRLDSKSPERLAAALRGGDPPVVGRVERGAVLLDLRAVDPRDDETLARAVARALAADH